MAYDDERVKLSRTPCNLVSISLIHCSLTFGTAPCVATGNQCYQTYNTCKDKSHFGWIQTANLVGEFVDFDRGLHPSIVPQLSLEATFEITPHGYTGKGLKFTKNSTAVGAAVVDIYKYLVAGSTYTMSCRKKSSGVSTLETFTIGFGRPNVAWTTYINSTISSNWSTISMQFTADANSIALLLDYVNASHGICVMDDVMVTGSYTTYMPSVPVKEYKFTSIDAPLPLRVGERPYVKSVKYLPIEIKDNITVSGRVNIDFYDEPDSDYDLDPNYAARSASYTTNAYGKPYFKKLFARYDNWYNRTVEIYEGFSVATNLSTNNFVRKFVGQIKEVSFDGNIVKVEAVDVLSGLKDLSYPQECEVELKNTMSAAATQVKVKDFGSLPISGGYLKVEDEIIKYTTVAVVQGSMGVWGGSTVVIKVGKPSKMLRGITRGQFKTTATSHDAKTKAQLCKLIGPANPFDIMQDILLTHASMASSSVDTAAFEALKTYPGRECKFVTLMTEAEDLETLYEELLQMTECRSWVNENQQITIGRGFLNNSTVVWSEISASANILEGSEDMSLSVEDGLTHGLLYWDKGVLADQDKSSGFERISMQTDTAMESDFYHGKRVDVEIYDRWLHTSLSYPASQVGESSVVAAVTTVSTNLYDPANVQVYADGMISRYINWRAPDRKVYNISLELKDATIEVGEQILFNSDLFLDASGQSLTKARCFVSKKVSDDWEQELTLEDYGKWTALIAPDGYADYSSSLTASALVYGFMSDTNGNMGDGSPGYVIY